MGAYPNQLLILTSDRGKGSRVFVLNLLHMSLNDLYTTQEYFWKLHVGNEYLILTSDNSISKVLFDEFMGYDFYNHVRHMINDPDIDLDQELASKITYPTLLNTSHFYSEYGAAKAISQMPSHLF